MMMKNEIIQRKQNERTKGIAGNGNSSSLVDDSVKEARCSSRSFTNSRNRSHEHELHFCWQKHQYPFRMKEIELTSSMTSSSQSGISPVKLAFRYI